MRAMRSSMPTFGRNAQNGAGFYQKKNVKSLTKWFPAAIIEIDMLQTRVSLDAALRPLTVCGVFVRIRIYLFGRFMAWILGLQKEEALFQKICREFALNEVEPIAAEIDAEERYPEETVQLMKYGLMGIQFPKEVGGSGGNLSLSKSRVMGVPPAIMSAHGTLCAWPIYVSHTPEQKEKAASADR